MRPSSDAWYVRLPDGRVYRASSTSVLRNQIVLRRIPLDIRVRRSPEDEWATLEWSPEFADMVPPAAFTKANLSLQTEDTAAPPARAPAPKRAGMAARLDAMELQTVGVRGLVEELLAAMDSALVPAKLLVACAAGILCGIIAPFAESLRGNALFPWPWFSWTVAGLLLVIIGVVANGLLTQMTYVELSSLRPARWGEARAGLGRYCLRFISAYLLIAGSAIVAIVLLRLWPTWIKDNNEGAHGWSVARFATLIGLLLELILWPIPGFALLLGPILVVEDCSAFAAVGQWWRLLRQHLGRVFLYEGLVAMLGAIFTFAFALPLVLAATGRVPADGDLGSAIGAALSLSVGLVASPLIAYLTVANVFIYLNLRYEVGTGPSRE